jgi:hypothetical protein
MQEACLEYLSVGRMCGKSPGYATPEGGSEGVAELITLSCAYIFVSRNLRFSIEYRTSFCSYARPVFVAPCLQRAPFRVNIFVGLSLF